MDARVEEIEFAKRVRDAYPHIEILGRCEPPYTLYKATDIATALGWKQIRRVIADYSDTQRCTIVRETPRGKHPVIYLTNEGIRRLVVNSRKPEAVRFCKVLGIDVHASKFLIVETETIAFIKRAFASEKMVEQKNVDGLRIDLYFPRVKLALECDEKYHDTPEQKQQDCIRQVYIQTAVNGCTFIRYRPHEKDFDMATLINAIHTHVINFRSTKTD